MEKREAVLRVLWRVEKGSLQEQNKAVLGNNARLADFGTKGITPSPAEADVGRTVDHKVEHIRMCDAGLVKSMYMYLSHFLDFFIYETALSQLFEGSYTIAPLLCAPCRHHRLVVLTPRWWGLLTERFRGHVLVPTMN